tara:strand:+ start:2186 stop:2404 length:219 start_codon:yes stop_codon:yes gene_type:complete
MWHYELSVSLLQIKRFDSPFFVNVVDNILRRNLDNFFDQLAVRCEIVGWPARERHIVKPNATKPTDCISPIT